MTTAQLLRTARAGANITQRELARRTNIPQSSISDIENGVHDPTVTTLSRLLRGARSQLAVLPTTKSTAAETAVLVRERILEGASPDAPIWQLADDLASSEPALRAALCVTPPPLTGDPRRDAWIAGLVAYRLGQAGVPGPAWVEDEARVAEADWPVSGIDELIDYIRDDTPEPFRCRHVLVTDEDLVSY